MFEALLCISDANKVVIDGVPLVVKISPFFDEAVIQNVRGIFGSGSETLLFFISFG